MYIYWWQGIMASLSRSSPCDRGRPVPATSLGVFFSTHATAIERHVLVAVATTHARTTTWASEDPFHYFFFYHDRDIYCCGMDGTVAIRSIPPQNNNSSSMSLPYLFFTSYHSPRIYIYLFLYFTLFPENIYVVLRSIFIHATKSACLHLHFFLLSTRYAPY